jgi:C4-dicarboxylate transporter, DcuC family
MAGPGAMVLGLLVVAAAVAAIARRIDVRLVLFVAALALGGIAGNLGPVVRTFLTTLSSEQFIVPICSAMGFAQVLRHAGCDQHLVQLLVKPIRRVRVLLIPGAVVIGCIVNISVISQASTAVAVGAVLVPLMRAARLSSTTIGASLLLGASIGGELLNPGAPEMNTVARVLKTESSACVERVLPLLFVQFTVATAAFWIISSRAERRELAVESPEAQEPASFRVNLFKAVVAIIPLVLLMVVGPPFNLVEVPRHWLVDPDRLSALRPEMNDALRQAYDRSVHEAQVASFGSRLIGVSMLIGAILAAFAAPSRAGATAKVYFEGAGYALTNIVSVIVAATCFGTGIKQLHLDSPIRELIGDRPDLVWPLAGGLTLAFATLCGSGMAATQSLFEVFAFRALGAEVLLRVGAVTSISAAAGRTMSPVAAVVLTCAKLTDADPLAMVRRVAVPLIVATVTTVAVAWWRGG